MSKADSCGIHRARDSLLCGDPRLRPRNESMTASPRQALLGQVGGLGSTAPLKKLRDLFLSGGSSTHLHVAAVSRSSAGPLPRFRPGRIGLGPRVHGRLAQRVLASTATQGSPSLRSNPVQIMSVYLRVWPVLENSDCRLPPAKFRLKSLLIRS